MWLNFKFQSRFPSVVAMERSEAKKPEKQKALAVHAKAFSASLWCGANHTTPNPLNYTLLQLTGTLAWPAFCWKLGLIKFH
jgi:hypothetical protein